tara:strand:- start:191 stop:412 length:222 start_codon:yes stop_codon:yes gene_type:complete
VSAAEILAFAGLALGAASKSDVRRAWRLADDGGTIQAGDARALFSHSRPEYHTTMALEIALVRLGCVTVEVAS